MQYESNVWWLRSSGIQLRTWLEWVASQDAKRHFVPSRREWTRPHTRESRIAPTALVCGAGALGESMVEVVNRENKISLGSVHMEL